MENTILNTYEDFEACDQNTTNYQFMRNAMLYGHNLATFDNKKVNQVERMQSVADTTALFSLLTEIKSLVSSQCEPKSWKHLQDVVSYAVEHIHASATQAEINDAYNKLQHSYRQLEFKLF